jgi:hypothetical protein
MHPTSKSIFLYPGLFYKKRRHRVTKIKCFGDICTYVVKPCELRLVLFAIR